MPRWRRTTDDRSGRDTPAPVYNPAGGRRDDGLHTVSNIASYARRVGDQVLVVLHLPEVDVAAAREARLRFVSGESRFGVPATTAPATPGLTVTASAPGDGLGDAVWQLVLVGADGDQTWRLEARLLAAAGQPVALLPGPAPKTHQRRAGSTAP
jgi:hypothetical protein